MGEGTLGVHLQQGEPETQTKLLQVFLGFALIADLNALQSSAWRYVSLLLVVELGQQVVAHLVLDTANGNIATDTCPGADVEVCLSCLQAKILFDISVLVQRGPVIVAYLSFIPICDQETKKSSQRSAVFVIQSLVVSTHQDKTDLACSTTKPEFVAT